MENEILDRIEANKSSNVNKDLSDNIVDNYKILYGEEVTGKYNENEIDQIIHRVRIDEDDERQRIISQRKDDVITDNANEIDYQINQSEERHYEMDLLNTERSKDQLDSDKNRLKIIPQVDHFKDSEFNTMDLRSEHNTQITYENTLGLQALFKSNYVHLDIKPENIILLSINPVRLKIIDLAYCMKINNKTCKTSAGTYGYASPEIMLHRKYYHNSDIWSLGIILYILITNQPLFDNENKDRYLEDLEYFTNIFN